MKINEMDILNKLTTIVNNEDFHSADWILANYLLDNIDNLKNLNIIKMSEECFVSRATIRRFAIKLGYENFYDLKNQIADIFEYKHVSYKKGDKYHYENISDITKNMNNLISEITAILTEDVLDTFTQKIINSSKLVFITSGKLNGLLKPFQEEFIICGKETILKTNLDDDGLFKSLKEDDLVIIVSASGKFFKLIEQQVLKIKSQKILLTLSDMKLDTTMSINKTFLSDIKVDIFNKYGLVFILDVIVNEFRRKI